jgi:ribosomal protein S27AE
VTVTQVVHVPKSGDIVQARVLCPKCKLVQPLSVMTKHDDRNEDVQCEKCWHEWRVEWPD